jgi:hypothetical protein
MMTFRRDTGNGGTEKDPATPMTSDLQQTREDVPDITGFFDDRRGCTVLREDRHKTILRCDAHLDTDGPLFIKIYRYRGMAHALRETLFGHRAARDLRTGRRLAAARIPVPAPVGAAADRTSWGLVRRSLLAARWVEDMRSLRDLVIPLFDRPNESGPVVSALADALGRFVANLHRSGVLCRDLNSGNFLVRRETDGTFRILLVDHESVRFVRRIPARHRTGNLADVAAILLPLGPDTPRMLCAAYLEHGGRELEELVLTVHEQAVNLLARREQDLDARFARISEARRSGGA